MYGVTLYVSDVEEEFHTALYRAVIVVGDDEYVGIGDYMECWVSGGPKICLWENFEGCDRVVLQTRGRNVVVRVGSVWDVLAGMGRRGGKPADAEALKVAVGVQLECKPSATALFGSRARDDYRKDSDVDVLLIEPGRNEPFGKVLLGYGYEVELNSVSCSWKDFVKYSRFRNVLFAEVLLDGFVFSDRGGELEEMALDWGVELDEVFSSEYVNPAVPPKFYWGDYSLRKLQARDALRRGMIRVGWDLPDVRLARRTREEEEKLRDAIGCEGFVDPVDVAAECAFAVERILMAFHMVHNGFFRVEADQRLSNLLELTRERVEEYGLVFDIPLDEYVSRYRLILHSRGDSERLVRGTLANVDVLEKCMGKIKRGIDRCRREYERGVVSDGR